MKRDILLRSVTIPLIFMFLGLNFLNKSAPYRQIRFFKSSALHNTARNSLPYSEYCTGEDDLAGYINFLKRHAKGPKVMNQKEFNAQYWKAVSYIKSHPLGKTSKDIRMTLINILKIKELLTGLYNRELVVTERTVNEYEKYTEHDLLFKDPEVGIFSVLLLVPAEPKDSYPAIIGAHGHGDSKEIFRDDYFGREFASEGFVVIIPTYRAMDASDTEAIITQELHFNGYTLMGMRIYETLLLVKYLKQSGLSAKDGIGIIGHSGGSNAATLFARISPDIKALVYDINLSPLLLISETNFMHCTTIPDLVYYNAQLEDFSNSGIPFLKLEYGYKQTDDLRKIIDFFKSRLIK